MLQRHFIALLALVLIIIPFRSGWAQVSDITPNLEASARDELNLIRSDLDDDVTNILFTRQTYSLSLDIPLTSVFLLSYNMRYTDLNTRTDFRSDDGSEEVNNTSNETFEPRVELFWDNPFFRWNNGFKFRKLDTQTDTSGVTRTEDNYFSRLRVDEGTYMPESNLQYEWFRRSDNLLVPETDSNENRLDVNLYKTAGPIQARYGLGATRTDNDITNIIQDRLVQNGIVSLSQSFFKNLVSVFGEYEIDANRNITISPPSGGTVENVRTAADGLFRDGKNDPDATPANPLDDSLTTGFSDLRDGDIVTKANPPVITLDKVDLDEELQNLAVRLPISQEVNKIFVYITDPNPPTSEAALDAITWRVFTGTASDTWTEIVGVTSDFNTIDNRFEITLPATVNSRFFRVRNTDSANEEILVTEMEVIGEETFLEKERQVEESFGQDLNTRLTIRPFRFLDFNYDFLYSEINTRPLANQTLERFHSGSFNFTPHPLFYFSGRAQRSYSRFTGEDEPPQVEERFSGAITSTPIPTVSQSLTFSRSEQRDVRQVGDVDTGRDDTFFYTITGDIYRNFTMGLDLNWSRSWDYDQSLPADITSQATLRLNTQLRPDVRISGDYSAGRRRGGVRSSPDRISTGDFRITYRPTSRVNTGARLVFRTEENNKGLDQEYRINWIVLNGGAVEFIVDYRYERTEEGGKEQHNGGLTAHWKINRNMIVDVGWNVFSENNGSRLIRHTGTFEFAYYR